MKEQGLKLIAKDGEDAQIISAVLQDAIVPVCDMLYEAAHNSFVLVVHRFLGKSVNATPEASCFERVCCAVNVRGVIAAQVQGLELTEHERMLDLLAILLEGNTLYFVFAGEARIRLQLKDWSMTIEDFGEPWPTPCQPCHDDAAVVT